MKIDVDRVVDGTALIISYPTGITYTAQCGGVGCTHPVCEGFVLSLGSFMGSFDDCSYGCQHIEDLSEEEKKKLGKDINAQMLSESKNWSMSILFDFDRINQMMEGWWPVVVNGFDDWGGTLRGFIHTGNCD
jgi:hypothetical protein